MLLAKNNFFLLCAIDKDGDVYITSPKFMTNWFKANWPDAALYPSNVVPNWIETICTPAEWCQVVKKMETPDSIETSEAPFNWPDKDSLAKLVAWVNSRC